MKQKRSITIEPKHTTAINKLRAARILKTDKGVSFSQLLNEVISKGLPLVKA